LWFFATACYLALLNVLDIIMNLTGLSIYRFTVVELGVFNAVWTITYIFSVRIATRIADRGEFKKNLALSLALILVSLSTLYYSLASHNKVLLYIAYSAHAVAASSLRVSVFTSILENYESYKWSRVNRRLVQTTLLIEGLVLALLSQIGFKAVVSGIAYLSAITVVLAVLSLVSIPQPTLLIERILYRIEHSLSRMLLPARAALAADYYSIGVPDKQRIAGFREKVASVGLVLICLVGLRISNEYVLTPLPYHMMNSVGLGIETIMWIYGLAKLVTALLLSSVFAGTPSKGYFGLALAIRLLSSMALYTFFDQAFLPVLLLALTLYSNTLVDIALYNLYIEVTYGYGAGYYSLVNEFSGFMGSLTSGLIYLFFGVPAILVLIVLSTMVFVLLAKNL